MKQIFTFLAGIVLIFSLGCKNTNHDGAQVVTSLAVYNATFYVLKNNPKLRPEFDAALTKLDSIVAGDVSANLLLDALNQIPVTGDAEKLLPAINSVKFLVQNYVSVPQTPEVSDKLKSWAGIVATGLRSGLSDSK